ncbi:nucleotide-diphosphate-sugar epimerase [Actinomycetospora sp. NBRC 106375]|uniref:NAD(P)H-binding protein n=1 Tax=Actinomycetospora sp. NBRC 106375 TaxID=3032207 RepID=UPI0024A142AB|nr:NAD(P)H-binding protein [Actinomycetospora sp. NBRC 106375]GLZ46316.1 nucleotide-diphosphate-sugar epimerase [Actinomycetospora sp. NBRC 106375]
MDIDTALVVGATGNVGAEVVRALVELGVPAVRALSRRGAPVDGATAVTGDLGDRASVADAWRGVDAVFLPAGHPDPPGLLADMRAAGVRRVVLLSTGAVVGGDLDNAVTRFNVVSEAAVRDAELAWTVLRPSGFMSNALGWAPLTGVVREPFADVGVAVIDPADIGAVAARALTDPGLAGRSLRLTGPEVSLPADRLAVLADLLGRDLRLEPEPDDAARARMSGTMPERYVDAFFRFFRGGEYDDGHVTSVVPDLLGRPARTFREWAEVHLDAFRAETVRP